MAWRGVRAKKCEMVGCQHTDDIIVERDGILDELRSEMSCLLFFDLNLAFSLSVESCLILSVLFLSHRIPPSVARFTLADTAI